MSRAFVDLTRRDSCEVFIDIAEIQAIMADDTGSKIFIRGSDEPFRVREHPRMIFKKMNYKDDNE